MTKERIKAIIIDPELQLMVETEIDNTLQGLQHAIGDHKIELVRINDKEDCYVDKEGLFRENQSFFILNGMQVSVPLAGKAVIVGATPMGNQTDTKLNLCKVSSMIEFKTRNEISRIGF